MSASQASADSVSMALRGPGDTRRLGRAIAKGLCAGDLVILEGSLGAGKTFLVQAVARALGVPASVPVTSPTFELVHELPGRIPVVHADLYRLTPGAALHDLGLVEHIGHDAVVLVEWGDRFAEALGGQGLWVEMALGAGKARSVRVSWRGALGREMFERLLPQLSGFEPVVGPAA